MFNKNDLKDAEKVNIISKDQRLAMLDLFKNSSMSHKSLNLSNSLFYVGGLLSIFAMTIFMKLAFDYISAYGTAILSIIYFFGGLKYSEHLKSESNLTPAGILATFSLVNFPLFIFSILYIIYPDVAIFSNDYRLFFEKINSWFIIIELSTISMGLYLIYRLKYSFLMMPISFCFWFISIDIIDILFDTEISLHIRNSAILIGSLMTTIGIYIDSKNKSFNDYSIWLYIFGFIPAWVAIMVFSPGDLIQFAIFSINMFFIFFGSLIKRKVFVVCGSIGSYMYITDLVFSIFKDYWFILSVFLVISGFILIKFGLYLSKNENLIMNKLEPYVPNFIKIISMRK